MKHAIKALIEAAKLRNLAGTKITVKPTRICERCFQRPVSSAHARCKYCEPCRVEITETRQAKRWKAYYAANKESINAAKRNRI